MGAGSVAGAVPGDDARSIRNERWRATWIDAVRDGRATMSQRARSAIDAHGGLEEAIALARTSGVHLVELVDDRGRTLVAASRHPFTSLC